MTMEILSTTNGQSIGQSGDGPSGQCGEVVKEVFCVSPDGLVVSFTSSSSHVTFSCLLSDY